jgi:hypothetical protein
MNGCPSHLAVDDLRLHNRSAPVLEAHLASCDACRARLAERDASAAEFEVAFAAPTWTRIEAAMRDRRRRSGRRWTLTALGAAGAAALLVVAAPGHRAAQTGPTGLVAKGRAPAQVTCRRGDQTFSIGPGDEVQPGDALRFRPLPVWREARYIQVGSVDGTGAYGSFYPPSRDGTSVPLPAGESPLEGSIRLDDAPGPERLLVVLSAAPLAVADVARAALAHAATGDRVDEIGGARVVSAWIILPKRRGSGPEPR